MHRVSGSIGFRWTAAAAAAVVGVGTLAVAPVARASGEPITLLIQLDPALSPSEVADVLASHGGTPGESVGALGLHEVAVDELQAPGVLAAYDADSAVVSAEIDLERQAAGAASDPGYVTQWALPAIGWEDVHDVATFSADVSIAVLDTGVDAATPDLAGRVEPGWSFDGSDPASDPNGHGTHTATIAAAASDDGVGIAGVSYARTSVMPVKVLGADGSGNDSDVIAGLVWAADHGADVAVMPFSNPGYSAALQAAIDYAWASGVVLVAAAGNDGGTAPTYPAGDANVVGVGATGADDIAWASSNRSDAVFLHAPGVDVTASDASGIASVTGTSASAALTAGAAALLRSIDPSASNATIVGRLARAADPLNEPGPGNGRVNVGRASTDVLTDGVTPVGAPGGGPFVGPYVVATARTWNGAGSTNYNNGFNWTPSGVPTALDALTIPGGAPRYPFLNSGTGGGLAQSIVVGNGASLQVTSTTLSVNGVLTNGTGGSLILSGGGSISVLNNLVNDGSFAISGTSTVTIPQDYSGGGTATMSLGTFKVGRNWRPAGGSFTAGGGTVQFTGNADSNATFAAATNQFYDVLVDAGADPRFSQITGSQVNITQNFTNNNPSLNVTNKATFTFNGSGPQVISSAGTATPFGNLVVNKPASTLTLATSAGVASDVSVNSGTLVLGANTLNRASAGGTFSVADGAALQIGGTGGFPSGYATRSLAPASSVTYNGSAQPVLAETYGNLTLTGSGLKTLPAAPMTVAGNFAMTMSASTSPAGPITVEGNANFGPSTTFNAGSSTHRVRGDFFNNSLTYNPGTSTVVLDGPAVQTVDGTAGGVFHNLTIDNPSGILLTNDISVAGGGAGGLVLSDGNITTGSFKVVIKATGAVNRTSGHVVGNLTKQISANGTLARTYEVGTALGYAPLDLVFRGVAGSGTGGFQNLTVAAAPGDHPDVATSGIDAAQSVNVSWSLVPTGTWTFTDYDATLGFAPSVIDAGADTTQFIVRRRTGGAWFAAAAGVRTPTSTESLGHTAIGSMAVGEASGDATTTSVTCPSTITYGASGTCQATVTTAIPGVAPSGTVTFSTDGSGTFSPSASCTVVPATSNSSTCSVTYSPTAVGTGTHSIGASFVDGSAYVSSVAVPASMAVTPAPLTITANDQTKPYGFFDPILTVTYSGLVNGDTAPATPPTCTIPGPHEDVAGSPYAITCSGAADPNYTITYVDGDLTVTPVPLTITADDKTKPAGAPDPAFTFTYTGLTNGDTGTATAPTCTVTGPHAAVGTYPITCSGAVDSNYTISYVAGTLTVVDSTPPVVVSIARTGTTPTNASSVQWLVTFSEPVTGVGMSDFALSGTGTSGASVSAISADSGTTRTVTVATGVSGSLTLSLHDDDSVIDGAGNPLAGVGTGTVGSGGVTNGSFAGETYTIDKTGPTITITTPPSGATYSLNQVVTASYTCSDPSGVATCAGPVANGAAISTATAGSSTFTVNATDSLGNAAVLTHVYSVGSFNFTGFFSPVDNLPTINTIKPGQAVPVKFSLGGYQGMSIFAPGYPLSGIVTCGSTAPLDAVEETVTAGASTLTYDAGTNQYHYVWKTQKTWQVGTCRQLVLKFVDGTTQYANFKMK